jgi:hypothetical protein
MNVVYHEKARQGGKDYSLLEQATERLQAILDGASGPVQAEWDRAEDEGGHVVYLLKLRDSPDVAEARFTPEELLSPSHMRFHLSRLWRDLLRARNHRLMQQLKEGSGTEEWVGSVR